MEDVKKNEVPMQSGIISLKSFDIRPKGCTICCLGFCATFLFLIGLFQTVVAIAFVEASRRNPVLITGPMFMGISGLLFIRVFAMCRTRRRLKNIALNGGDINALDEENLHMDGNTIIIRADQLPPMLTLNAQQLQMLSPDEKRLLLAQPAMPPVDVCAPAPAYYTGCSRLPQVTSYTPPEDGEPVPVPVIAVAEEKVKENREAEGSEPVKEGNENAESKAQEEITQALTAILTEDSPAVV